MRHGTLRRPSSGAAAAAAPPRPPAERPPPDLARRLAAIAAAAVLALVPADAALALLNSPNAAVPRTAEAALRRAIPAFNADVKRAQRDLEGVQFRLRIPQRKPWAQMADDVAAAAALAADEAAALRGVLPADEPRARELLAALRAELGKLNTAVGLKDADRTSVRVAAALAAVAELELLQAPGLPYPVPAQYASLPRLEGRAVAELVIEKGDGRAAFVEPNSEAGPSPRAALLLTLDGYSAPLTAGNFAANRLAHAYDGRRLTVTETAVLLAGAPGAERPLPLELLAAGDFEPRYRSPLDVRGGELPVLPMSVFGAAAMGRLPPGAADAAPPGSVSGADFFLYKFQRQAAGLAGLSFDEGEFGTFAYVTRGAPLLAAVETGDRVVSARLVAGAERLVRPAPPPADAPAAAPE
jgi:hypothetical protein